MDDGANGETVLPDLRDIEVKIGRKIPEGLIKCMRDEASSMKTDSKLQSAAAHEMATADHDTGKKGLDEKIRKLKIDMALLRSLDVKILQQLLALHEGMEAVRWLAEERSTLTSRCSSLTGSQYSLGEGPDTSWRGSWSSLHDPNDKLDNISIGSYLDTLADDLDEYGPAGSESVLCSTAAAAAAAPPPPAPPGPGAAPAGGRTGTVEGAGGGGGVGGGGGGGGVGGGGGGGGGGGVGGGGGGVGGGGGGCVGTSVATGPGTAAVPNGRPAGAGAGSVAEATVVVATGGSRSTVTGRKTGAGSQAKEGPKGEATVWTKTKEVGKKDPVGKDNAQARPGKNKGTLEKSANKTGGSDPIQPCLGDKLGKSHSPKFKAYTNGKKELDTCKMNGKMHLEYDAHWRWVQSQDDVTFL